MAVGNNGKLAMSEKVYDFAKDAALIYLPALGVLYAALAGIWGLPYAVAVMGSITAFDTFLGIVLKISSTSYNAAGGSADGSIAITNGNPSKLSIELTPEELAGKESIVLNVSAITQAPDVVTQAVADTLPPVDPTTVSQ